MIPKLAYSLSLILFMLFTGIALSGCTKDCEELCEEGQAGDCTAIEGDCRDFCNALDGVSDPSGCNDEREDYEDCLNQEDDVCDVNCDSEEGALEECVGAYCLLNLTDDDCQVLIESF